MLTKPERLPPPKPNREHMTGGPKRGAPNGFPENNIKAFPGRVFLLIKTDIARPLSGDDVDARTSRALSLRGKRSDQSGANTAITVAFVEIDVQMARIAIAQWRK
jgi:hypothetical protein